MPLFIFPYLSVINDFVQLIKILAENQRQTMQSPSQFGAVDNLGECTCITEEMLTEKPRYYFYSLPKVHHMGIRTLELSREGIGPEEFDFVESLWISGG